MRLSQDVLMAPRFTLPRITPRIAIAAAVSVVLMTAAFVGVALATDQSSFCTSCHEMRPFTAAHSVGAHKGVSCIACHVGTNPIVRLEHKFVALQEVRDHLFAPPKFPLSARLVEPVSNAKCQHCHAKITVTVAGFSHDQHATGRQCVSCHAEVGHTVTPASLAAAGVLSSARISPASYVATAVAASGEGTANLPGHVDVPCSSCHNMAATPCSTCHKPNHKPRGECSTCHQTGAKFVFTHPSSNDCASCHDRPVNHNAADCVLCHLQPGVAWTFTHPVVGECQTCHKPTKATHKHPGACATCHKNRGVNWAFSHPVNNTCATCHSRPAGHRNGTCATCHHNRGVSWAFTHPGSSACQSCHNRPAGHKQGSCATCHHQPGRSWAFTHPSSSARCLNCHSTPSGHVARTTGCPSCHRTGVSWKFLHPGRSASCSSCHKTPASHYGTNCASCHKKPGVSWAFVHPSTTMPGWKSMACPTCHPSGPPKVYCTCHNGNNPSGN